MADNTTLNTGSTGDVIRTEDKGGVKTQVVLVDVGGLGAESLFTGAVVEASAAAILAQLTALAIAQGTAGTSQVGPLIQALVGDTPPSVYIDGYVQPLSITQQGRLRVSSEPSVAMFDFYQDPFEQILFEPGVFDKFVSNPELNFWA